MEPQEMEGLGVVICVLENQTNRDKGTLTVLRSGEAIASFMSIQGRRRLVHLSKARLTLNERKEARSLAELFWPKRRL